MKINFGCGATVLDGFYNIDAARNRMAKRDPDLIHVAEFNRDGTLHTPIPLPNCCAKEVHAYHVIEHVYRWEAPALVMEWRRMLDAGGKLVLELPNILHAARNLLAGTTDQMSMWPLYGDWSHKDPYMMHKHGYTPTTIRSLLAECGFQQITLLPPQTHGARANRDMRVEAVK